MLLAKGRTVFALCVLISSMHILDLCLVEALHHDPLAAQTERRSCRTVEDFDFCLVKLIHVMIV